MSLRCKCLEYIGHSNYLASDKDLIALQAVGISFPVNSFVMLGGEYWNLLELSLEFNRRENDLCVLYMFSE